MALLYNCGNAYFNTENNTGGYAYSYLNQTVIGTPTTTGNISGTINQQLYAEFGNYLITYKERLSNRVYATSTRNNFGGMLDNSPDNTSYQGSTSGDASFDVQALIFSEAEIYGKSITSSSLFDNLANIHQFPLFKYHFGSCNEDATYFLRDIPSYTRFTEHLREGTLYPNSFQYQQGGQTKTRTSGVVPYFMLGTDTLS